MKSAAPYLGLTLGLTTLAGLARANDFRSISNTCEQMTWELTLTPEERARAARYSSTMQFDQYKDGDFPRRIWGGPIAGEWAAGETTRQLQITFNPAWDVDGTARWAVLLYDAQGNDFSPAVNSLYFYGCAKTDNSNGGGNTDPGNTNGGGNTDPGNNNGGGNTDPGNTNGGGNTDPGNNNGGGNTDPGNTNGGGNTNPGNTNGGGNTNPGGNNNGGGNNNPGTGTGTGTGSGSNNNGGGVTTTTTTTTTSTATTRTAVVITNTVIGGTSTGNGGAAAGVRFPGAGHVGGSCAAVVLTALFAFALV
ncbi:hypothetical protein OC834_004383 [Tilletia horrida]|nr:hypothetical protein OC834_004383 [Tilletia horrida]